MRVRSRPAVHNIRIPVGARADSIAWRGCLALVLALSACDGARGAPGKDARAATPSAATLASLGREIFFDSTLSASGRMSCASCHDPNHGWGPANDLPVQAGGLTSTTPGVRAVPTLGYAQDTPPFTEHFRENDGDDSEDQGPTGGRMWDGRARSSSEQAALPLLSPFEMANASQSAVIERLKSSAVAPAFRAAFGARVFEDSITAWNGLLSALDVFQQSPEEFYPYSSKYDAFLRGQTTLTSQERRGLALFNNPAKGNCAQCHPSALVRGAFPQFTDRGLIALGVPRNARISINADSNYFDLGLCGPSRNDFANRAEYCGLFKTPTLRNVSKRHAFFHNGVFATLEDVLRFYAERDVRPQQFYAADKHGVVRKYDDLPARYWNNVNVDAPFGGKPGDRPAFSTTEAQDIIAFLRTLDDGFVVHLPNVKP